MSSKPLELAHRRAPGPKWLRYLVGALILAVFLPITKLFRRGWPRFMSRSMTKYLGKFPSYSPTAQDVLVCSYFKSGTNWTLQMAVQIAHRGHADFEHIHDLVPWPDMPERARYSVSLKDDEPQRKAPTGLRIIKTHLALGLVPYTADSRYICVVRDPKDVFVSSYYFTRATAMGALMPSVDGWLDAYLSPDTALGSWAEHLASYWRMRAAGNVLFLTYETMRADLPGTVDRIAAFMGVPLSSDERTAVIAQSTFEHMKTIGRKFDAPGSPWAPAARGAMMRRGQRGSSGELLSAADQRRIDDYWRAELRRLDCDFPYDESFGVTAQ